MFLITVWHEDVCLAKAYCRKNLAKALFYAGRLSQGIPSAWVGIRREGDLVAELSNDWRGERSEAIVWNYQEDCRYPVSVATELNPRGPMFDRSLNSR